jgi:hypothetical protein
VAKVEVELPWLNLVSLADKLLDHLYKRLEEQREGVMTRYGGSETGGYWQEYRMPLKPSPPAGPGEGPQRASQEKDGPRGGAQPPAVQGEPPVEGVPSAVSEGPPAGQQAPPAEGDQPAGPKGPPTQSTGPTDGPPATSRRHVRGDARRVPHRGRGCGAPV